MSRAAAWPIWLAVLCLAATAAAVSLEHSGRIPAELVTNRRALDLWFDADVPDVYGSMCDAAHKQHRRSSRHVLFPLASYPPAQLFRTVLGLDAMQSVRATMAALAAVWAGLLFLLLILLGCAALDAILFCLLAIASAASLFWFAVPETWAFGSTSLLAALAIALWRQQRGASERWLTLGSALTLSMTTSNWMMGWAIAFAALPWRRALWVTTAALALVLVVGRAQMVVFPHAGLVASIRHLKMFAFQENEGSFASIAQTFVLRVMVMPEVAEVEHYAPLHTRLSVQDAAPGSGSRWGWLASVSWLGLLAAGVWGIAAERRRHRALASVLAATLAGQLLLHLVYGREETFLFGLHWLPLLIVVAAFGSLTRARQAVRTLAALCLVSSALNNEQQFERAVELVQRTLPVILPGERDPR